MSGVPNANQAGPLLEHTTRRYRELVELTKRIDEIECRLEEIEDVTRRHWFKLATFLTADGQHGNNKQPKRIYICPCCHEFVELMPKNLIVTRVNTINRNKRREKVSSSAAP